MAHDVFISYSTKDKPTADAACAVLESKGLRCWIAPRDILPGADWGESILDAIAGARALVLIFSSHANTSPQIKREVERSVHRGIPIIPLRIEDVAPAKSLEYFISTPHWLDAFTPPLERHLNYLADVLRHILAGEPPPAAAKATAVSRRPDPAIAGVAILCVVLAAGGWLLWRKAASPPESGASAAASGVSPTTPVQPGVWGWSSPRDGRQVRLDFDYVDTARAPGNLVAADPYLHVAPIPITIERRSPPQSRVVFMNNLALYEGRAVAPTASQNFLTQIGTDNVAASFSLGFSEPVESVTFMVPRVYPTTASGITFPAWRAIARRADGKQLSAVEQELVRQFADFPAQTYTLRAPGFDPIAAVEFSSDPRLDGRPFAAFGAILIEQITLERR